MSKVEDLEHQIEQLSEPELIQLRQWFAEFDAEAWDRQFESDVEHGRLDGLAEEALREHAKGKTTKL